MECFPLKQDKQKDESYQPLIGEKWILLKTFADESKEVTPESYIYCQAYVQVLFVEKDKWVPGMIGELIAYKKKTMNNDNEVLLSFFSGPRQRFLINVSEIQKLSKPHSNLLVITHGKTIMGFNFPLEHQNRVDVFYQQLRPHLQSTIFAQKLKRAAENVSEEMKKTANKLKNTFSIEDKNVASQWLNNQKKMITKIAKKESTNASHNRRKSDPLLYPRPILAPEYTSVTKNEKDKPKQQPKTKNGILLSTDYHETPRTTDNPFGSVKKRVTFNDAIEPALRRSQSLRRFYYNEVIWIEEVQSKGQETEEEPFVETNVKSLIKLWNSKL